MFSLLATRGQRDANTDVCVCQTLNGSLTLELVNEKYWKVRKPLELYYAPTKDLQPPQSEG